MNVIPFRPRPVSRADKVRKAVADFRKVCDDAGIELREDVDTDLHRLVASWAKVKPQRRWNPDEV